MVIDLPEGSTAEAENVKVTVLAGLDRFDVVSETTVDGGSHVAVSFPEPTPTGSPIMIECNRTLLPADGGSYGVAGNYTTADGQSHDMPPIDQVIDVISSTPSEQLSSWLDEQEWVQAWNSKKFLHLFFDPTIIVASVLTVFSGWLLALGLVAVSFPLAIPIDLFWSFLRMVKSRIPRAIGPLISTWCATLRCFADISRSSGCHS